ncbi:uncharacterized protein PFL1_05614 [Pseudozyma flocculosa PF-1]|uniref:Uncharacterized protein n=1 Tax=Pseudozyma flocculosa PF-1 TaxID=1277687 RepID=A0A061H3R0_9BASI|nr:uncharacterized protein PFL1_05614 [Pseudozyma flocculosa PF-1]EPQ26979.1 hypothetical protein PFL1_05614 [Pseudozyma flocculosa PF-1]
MFTPCETGRASAVCSSSSSSSSSRRRRRCFGRTRPLRFPTDLKEPSAGANRPCKLLERHDARDRRTDGRLCTVYPSVRAPGRYGRMEGAVDGPRLSEAALKGQSPPTDPSTLRPDHSIRSRLHFPPGFGAVDRTSSGHDAVILPLVDGAEGALSVVGRGSHPHPRPRAWN